MFSQRAVILNEGQDTDQKKVALDVRYMMIHRELNVQSKKMRKRTESEVSCVGFLLDRG